MEVLENKIQRADAEKGHGMESDKEVRKPESMLLRSKSPARLCTWNREKTTKNPAEIMKGTSLYPTGVGTETGPVWLRTQCFFIVFGICRYISDLLEFSWFLKYPRMSSNLFLTCVLKNLWRVSEQREMSNSKAQRALKGFFQKSTDANHWFSKLLVWVELPRSDPIKPTYKKCRSLSLCHIVCLYVSSIKHKTLPCSTKPCFCSIETLDLPPLLK